MKNNKILAESPSEAIEICGLDVTDIDGFDYEVRMKTSIRSVIMWKINTFYNANVVAKRIHYDGTTEDMIKFIRHPCDTISIQFRYEKPDLSKEMPIIGDSIPYIDSYGIRDIMLGYDSDYTKMRRPMIKPADQIPERISDQVESFDEKIANGISIIEAMFGDTPIDDIDIDAKRIDDNDEDNDDDDE